MSLPTLESLEGAVYGPSPYRLDTQKVADYVSATFDDPARWQDHAPPSIAAAALFVVAPNLLFSPLMTGRSVVHGDQGFVWHRPIPVGGEMSVEGRVSRLRQRAGVWFVGFEFEMGDDEGALVSGTSTFLATPRAENEVRNGSVTALEPPLEARGENGRLEHLEPPESEGELPALERSASRMDLVVYAAASGDFNPIHWDHQVAVEAGLPGVVVHGLLQSAWMCQAAARHNPGPHPLTSARFRYRSPLRPGSQAVVVGRAKTDGTVALEMLAGGVTTVAGTFELRVD